MFFLTQNFCADSSVLLLKTVVFTTFSRIKLIETSMSTPKIEIYISVDVETSGPIPGEYSLLSIGARSVGHPEQNFYSELKPRKFSAKPRQPPWLDLRLGLNKRPADIGRCLRLLTPVLTGCLSTGIL